jgi:hypothetical protein
MDTSDNQPTEFQALLDEIYGEQIHRDALANLQCLVERFGSLGLLGMWPGHSRSTETLH